MDLTTYLARRRVKQSDFAARIGVSVTALRRYLGGERRPTADILERIHKATGGAVQPNDFFSFVKRGGSNQDAA